MASTKIEICSNALLLAYGQGATDLTSSDASATASSFFDLLTEESVGTNDWRFCVKLQPLSRNVVAPLIDEWEYAYELPSDYISLVRIYPQSYDFQVYGGGFLYSNLTEITAEYRYSPLVSQYPAYFVTYITYSLASQLALMLAQSSRRFQILESKMKEYKMSGMAIDAQSHPTHGVVSSPIIAVRGGGNDNYRLVY